MPWYIPTNAMRSTDVVVMLGQCCRRWPKIKATLDQGVVFDGSSTRWSSQETLFQDSGSTCPMPSPSACFPTRYIFPAFRQHWRRDHSAFIQQCFFTRYGVPASYQHWSQAHCPASCFHDSTCCGSLTGSTDSGVCQVICKSPDR